MNFEYLLFNLIVLFGPVLFSFDRQVRFVHFWPAAFISIVTMMIPFIIWDSLVSGVHWFFHAKYTLPVRIFLLPPGEILFFISVPFACLFIWQIIATFKPPVYIKTRFFFYVLIFFATILASIMFIRGKMYTALVLISIVFTVILDLILKTDLLSQKRTFIYVTMITILIFIFDSYLTSRPVIYYAIPFYTGFKIRTIPIEDFGYGYSLILSSTILFEKWKGVLHAS